MTHMHALATALARQQQMRLAEATPPPQIHSPEELDAYVTERVKELDALIVECETSIESLKLKKDEKVRAWYLGALNGLKLARSAWIWWQTKPSD